MAGSRPETRVAGSQLWIFTLATHWSAVDAELLRLGAKGANRDLRGVKQLGAFLGIDGSYEHALSGARDEVSNVPVSNKRGHDHTECVIGSFESKGRGFSFLPCVCSWR